jgi:hypothetical protein
MEMNGSTRPHKEHSSLSEISYLAHVLSPLDRAARAAHFETFSYSFNGIDLPIGKAMLAELKHISHHRLKLCEEITKALSRLPQLPAPEISAFLDTPLSDIAMSTRLRHLLLDANCYTLLDVAELGSKGLSRQRGIGLKTLNEVRRIFIHEGCAELFDDVPLDQS